MKPTIYRASYFQHTPDFRQKQPSWRCLSRAWLHTVVLTKIRRVMRCSEMATKRKILANFPRNSSQECFMLRRITRKRLGRALHSWIFSRLGKHSPWPSPTGQIRSATLWKTGYVKGQVVALDSNLGTLLYVGILNCFCSENHPVFG